MRNNLPFRKNTEGYFTDKKSNILAQISKQGFIIFPGGGIEENESPEESIVRETFEETGAIIEKLKFISILRIIWDENWAKTEKQKERYEKYQGDEMYFFSGQIKEFKKIIVEEDSWPGEKLIEIKKVVSFLKQLQFKNDSYRQKQLKFLQNL